MSIDRCSKCGALVDTDFDTEFYGETGEGFNCIYGDDVMEYSGLCECCRDELLVSEDDRIGANWMFN